MQRGNPDFLRALVSHTVYMRDALVSDEAMTSDMLESMYTPMHLILPSDPNTGFGDLYLGSLSARANHELLQEKRVTHIVEVLEGWRRQEAGAAFTLYRIAIADNAQENLTPRLDGACADIHEKLGCGKNVLVHCVMGISRSSSVVIAYLIRYHNMTYDSALELVKQKRRCIEPNTGFEKSLREWEIQLRTSGVLYVAHPDTSTI